MYIYKCLLLNWNTQNKRDKLRNYLEKCDPNGFVLAVC